jgi:pimeloyl-ACP methyl ester carboxylesterase
MKKQMLGIMILSYFLALGGGQSNSVSLESNTPNEVGWVGRLLPASGSTTRIPRTGSVVIYVQVYKAGVTDGPGQGMGISCEIYWSPVDDFSSPWTNIQTSPMMYSDDIDENDHYRGTLDALDIGYYEFTARCSDDNGTSWTWADLSSGNGMAEISDIENGIILPGSSPETNTGLLPSAGTRIVFSASGSVNTMPDDPGNPWGGPDGNGGSCNPDCLLPSAQWGALIGRVGSDGQWFFIGSHNTIEADRSGALILAVNDNIYHYDNIGAFTVYAIIGNSPIVFVHGWHGWPPWGSCGPPNPDSDFGLVDNDLWDTGYHVEYAFLETSPCYTPPLVDNVSHLRTAVNQAKAATGQDKVILIAHSMGGLVSRAYVEGPDYADDVEALFTFGSPHQGVPADLLVFLANGLSLGEYCEDYQPAACDFSELGMALFNQDHPDRADGTTYHVISGDAPFSPRSALAKVTYFLLSGGDDGLVQTDSGTGLGGIVDRWTTDEVHGANSGPRSYFIRDGGQSTSYTQCLKPVLVDETTNTCGSLSALQATEVATTTLAERTSFEYGTLLLGQITTHTVSLEGGPALFAARWQTGTLELTLVDPNGQVIDPAYAASHPDIVTYDADTTQATYHFPDAMPGVWKMTLRAASVPPDGSAYTSFVAFDSSLA